MSRIRCDEKRPLRLYRAALQLRQGATLGPRSHCVACGARLGPGDRQHALDARCREQVLDLVAKL